MGASYRTKQILIMVFALILASVVAYVRVKNELQIQRAREARRLAEKKKRSGHLPAPLRFN